MTSVNRTAAELMNFTCEAHESSLSGLSPQPFHVFVVDVDQVDSLQPESFGGHDHLLPRVEQLPGILRPRGPYKRHIMHVGHMYIRSQWRWAEKPGCMRRRWDDEGNEQEPEGLVD